ncbi:gliding motility-associated C-terminal domain-containing protein [Pedobacter rhodius]|uniref:Gliding motility-associated C-terminal domain-containing protein n=1 Tax=Pedobacter rhodius TaxID=3004098 RepID=A0ABT4KVG8_9SPHI|nr:gliding motility-associated C-terminal domain-containing protein [Pedobacter sp. SJ11]MCZ4222775.1 gliding motility-associated C-terminal domain-containing protein [Pedobacter sp. SJ11]
MINKIFFVLVMVCIAMTSNLKAQLCPENIGFENGNFQNWKLYAGSINTSGVVINEVALPVSGRHTIQTDKTAVDPFGKFPVVLKNSGSYTVKLGNSGTGNQAEGVSYLINIPANRNEFTLTYQYAVVFEDPNHAVVEQPRFIARVKDLETGNYIPCASFQYIATSTLPGFKKSSSSSTVIYKEWTPVTINLSGYQGKQLLLEFITGDCTLGGHFGYAYVDVNNLCGDLILGNTYCKSSEELNVNGPSGFQTYTWYNGDRSIKYGTGQGVKIKPTPPDGTKIILDLVPFTGFGCPSTLTAIVQSVDYQLQLLPKNTVCQGSSIDLISDDYVLNRNADFSYFAFEDKDLTIPVKNPVVINEKKTYYIMATNYKGCESVASVDISLFDVANITLKNPDQVCYTETVDITKNEIYVGDLKDIIRTYFTDAAATKPLSNPGRINLSGRYYVKLTNNLGCSKILPVDVVVNPKPILKIINPAGVCFPSTVNIAALHNFAGSDNDLKYAFYYDAGLTQPVSDPERIDKSGTYYIKAINSLGCVVSDKINVTIYELPVLILKDPSAVCYPATVDITNQAIYLGTTAGVNYSFYTDSNLTNKLIHPDQVAASGAYYVKITNQNGCSVFDKINVTINPLPVIVLNTPKPIFDYDYIDLTSTDIVKGSKGYVKKYYYTDATLTKSVSDPTKINKAGVYYISLESDKGCSITSSIELNILPAPQIIVPTAFTPQKLTNNYLYPFFTSIKQLTSFKVFNKWGILVYETNTMTSSGWDGLFKTKMQPMETFSWFAEGIDVLGGKYQAKGKTILIL